MGEIVQAKPQDTPELVAIFDRTNDYGLARAGVRLWAKVEIAHAALKAQVERGECWVMRDQSRITAMIAFNDASENWGERGQDGQALYFYKWIKDPATAKDDEALELLKFVADRALGVDKPFLRCDTVSELTGLIDYYKRLGFHEAGEFVYDFSDRPGILLEIPAEAILGSS